MGLLEAIFGMFTLTFATVFGGGLALGAVIIAVRWLSARGFL